MQQVIDVARLREFSGPRNFPRQFVPVPEWAEILGYPDLPADVADQPCDSPGRVAVAQRTAGVYVRPLSAAEWEAYEFANGNDRRGGANKQTRIRARLVILSCCDAEGKPLFDETDIAWVEKLPARGVDRVWQICWALNSATIEAAEEEVKNSEPTPSANC